MNVLQFTFEMLCRQCIYLRHLDKSRDVIGHRLDHGCVSRGWRDGNGVRDRAGCDFYDAAVEQIVKLTERRTLGLDCPVLCKLSGNCFAIKSSELKNHDKKTKSDDREKTKRRKKGKCVLL